jgi:hypothetical protein
MKNVFYILLFISGLNLNAQSTSPRIYTQNHNTWFMYNGDHKFAKKWGLHLEAQIRRADGLAQSQQWMFRTGLNYHISPTAFASVGYAYVETYPYGAFAAKSKFPENRLWEQVQLKHTQGKVEIVNRFRLEQRYVNAPISKNGVFSAGPAVYSNRFRLLNRFSVPFKGKSIGDKSFYLTAYDELFVNFGKKVNMNIFDQNRAFLGLGYKIPKIGKLEFGYLNQLILKSDGIKVENNHTLVLGLNSTIDFKKV